MKIFLAGASGFVGSHVLAALSAERGPLVRSMVEYEGFVGSHVQDGLRANGHTVTAWSRKNGALPDSLHEYDAVYNCVGQLGQYGIPDRAYYDAHAAFPMELIQRMNQDALLVQISSAYCSQPEGTIHRGYVESKLLGERIIKAMARRYCIIRPGLLYGPRDRHHLPLFQMINRLGAWCPIPGGAICCPTYVVDLAREMSDPTKLSGMRTIAGQPVTMPVFMGLIAKAAGKQAPHVRIPSIIKRDFFTQSHIFSSDRPFAETPLLDGLTATVASYRTEGVL